MQMNPNRPLPIGGSQAGSSCLDWRSCGTSSVPSSHGQFHLLWTTHPCITMASRLQAASGCWQAISRKSLRRVVLRLLEPPSDSATSEEFRLITRNEVTVRVRDGLPANVLDIPPDVPTIGAGSTSLNQSTHLSEEAPRRRPLGVGELKRARSMGDR